MFEWASFKKSTAGLGVKIAYLHDQGGVYMYDDKSSINKCKL